MKHIIAGDMNINILSNDTWAEEYLNILSSYGFVSMINLPTRPQSGTCLDHFFVRGFNPLDDDADAGVLHYLVTDHYPVILGLDLEMKFKNNNPKNVKRYISYYMLKKKLKSESWLKVYEHSDVNKIADSFVDLLAQHIEDSTNTVKLKRNDRMGTKWITPAICKLINHKNKSYCKLKNEQHNLDLKSEYLKYKNDVHRKIKEAKYYYFQNRIRESSESKALWDCVKDIL